MRNFARDFRLQCLRLPGVVAQAATFAFLLGASVSGSAMSATVILDDFENGFGGLNGQLQSTGPITAIPKPGTQLGMRINMAGQGGCDHFVGGSSALCGADTRKWAGENGVVLRYDVDFRRISSILFDLAAFSDNDPFDQHDGVNPNTWGDYLRISSLIGGTRTLLAEFTGVPQSQRTPETAFGMVSTGAGASLGQGISTGATFETVSLSALQGASNGKGALLFEIRSTGSSEQIGLDNIRYTEVPLPAALSFSLIGLAALGTTSCLRRRRTTASS